MDKKTPAWLLALPLAFFLTVILGIAMLGASDTPIEDSGGGGGDCYGAVTGSQTAYVRTVIGVAKSMHINQNGQIIAVMVMFQETGIREDANDGVQSGIDAGGYGPKGEAFWLNAVKASMKMPHDAVGSDHDSVGLFQQRPSMGWSDSDGFTATSNPKEAVERLLNPSFTAMKFFQSLQKVSGWEHMEPTVAAQKVQGSADGSAYAKWQDRATALVQRNQNAPAVSGGTDSIGTGGSGGSSNPGDADAGDINVTMPIDSGKYKLGTKYSKAHQGQDFLAKEGTPIKAVADGTVVAEGSADSTMGNWIVIDHDFGKVKTGDGEKDVMMSSVYGNMSADSIKVKNGDKVKQGDTIAKVGKTGEAKQPQLHFEIWPDGRFNAHRHSADPMTVLNSKSDDSCSGGVSVGGTAGAMINAGLKWLGTPYSWGGGTLTGPSLGIDQGANTKGFDCSGLVRYMVYQGAHYTLPRTAGEQYNATKSDTVGKAGLSADKLQPGDLLFYGDASYIHHVTMYIGDYKGKHQQMIEAPQTGEVVHVTPVRLGGDFYAATRLHFKK